MIWVFIDGGSGGFGYADMIGDVGWAEGQSWYMIERIIVIEISIVVFKRKKCIILDRGWKYTS